MDREEEGEEKQAGKENEWERVGNTVNKFQV